MVKTLEPKDAAQLLATETSIVVIDVRDEREWCTGHVAGSRLVPLETFRANPEAALDRDAAVLFVCAKGVRSLTAAKLVERLGWSTIYSLEGGTKEWVRAGLPLVTDDVASVAA